MQPIKNYATLLGLLAAITIAPLSACTNTCPDKVGTGNTAVLELPDQLAKATAQISISLNDVLVFSGEYSEIPTVNGTSQLPPGDVLDGYEGDAISYEVTVDNQNFAGEARIERQLNVEIRDGVCQDLNTIRIDLS